MSTIKDGGPAFPIVAEDNIDTVFERGMTLRDYFAGQIVGQMIGWCQTNDGWDPRNVVENAYQLADAMLAARDAQP